MNRDQFNKLMKLESTNFMEVLVGADASSGLPLEAMAEMRKVKTGTEKHNLLQIALYDVLISGYLRGYMAHLPDRDTDSDFNFQNPMSEFSDM